jgi:hypothetical protein
MTIYKVVIAPTNLYGTHDVEFSANTNTSTHLVYLVDLSAATYSGCSLYHPHLTGTGATYSLLSCGPLISNTATIGNYVIDWHLNSTSGETILISGNSGNTDPAIAAYHTFTDVPVPGGNLYPVIRYVYIDGFKYVSVYDGSARYSPDFINCLDPITIQNINCGNGTLIGQTYTHSISYTFGGTSSELSTRSLNFDLNSDGSTKYLAWEFTGVEVPDTMKITYTGSTTDVTSYWTVGTQATTNYLSTPKVYNGYSLRSMSNLTGITYVNGDKLKIEVTPNANNNTNWTLKMKCLTGTTFNCTNFPLGVNVINPASINMQYITGSTCYYRLNFSVMSGNTLFNNSDLNKYFSVTSRSLYVYGTDTNMYVQLTAPMSAYTFYNILGQGTCTTGQTTNSVTTISQSGNVITLSFNDINDYNIYKNGYNYLTGLTNMSNYSTDPTNVNHYKKIILYALSGTSCGDVKANDYAYFHISSPVTFDDINKVMTISMVNITNGLSSLSGASCNNGYDIANNFINYVPLSNNNITTKIRYTNPFGGWYMVGPSITALQTDATNEYFYAIHPTILNNVCNLTAPWAISTGGTGDFYIDQYPNHYLMFKARIKVTITNPSDPLNNFIVYNGVDYNTGQVVPFYQIYP